MARASRDHVSTLEIVVRCLAGIALIAGNAVFVVSEFSLTRGRRPRRRAGASAAIVAIRGDS